MQTREPGGTPIADQIRAILLDAGNVGITPMTELLLLFAARAQHVSEKVCPALERGEIVLCDRFADSTWAYQGYARGLGTDLVEQLNRLATGGLEPNLTLLFDLPVEIGLARANSRADQMAASKREDRFERERLAFHQKLREGFLKLAEREKNRFRLIDAKGSIDAVWLQTKTAVAEVLLERQQ